MLVYSSMWKLRLCGSIVNLLVGVVSSGCMFIMHQQLSERRQAYVDVVRACNDGVEYLFLS